MRSRPANVSLIHRRCSGPSAAPAREDNPSPEPRPLTFHSMSVHCRQETATGSWMVQSRRRLDDQRSTIPLDAPHGSLTPEPDPALQRIEGSRGSGTSPLASARKDDSTGSGPFCPSEWIGFPRESAPQDLREDRGRSLAGVVLLDRLSRFEPQGSAPRLARRK